jgi:lysophospholipase L1-like esterase
VRHDISATHDAIEFDLIAQNPTDKRSEAHWAQPCIRLDAFTGRDKTNYLDKCFIFVDGKLTRMPTPEWAMHARYTPGQVWAPHRVPRPDVNPRPLSTLVPSNGLIGAFSADERMLFAVAFEPYQELFQGVITCLHSDFRLGGLAPGESKKVRGKIYVVSNDAPKLLARYEADFPEHKQPAPWVEPMRKVHAKFTGTKGTFAQFGDSITITMAYWAPLQDGPKNLSPVAADALKVVNGHMLKDCWRKWKGPDFGNNGSMTIRWADENVATWLKKHNPEAALIMFGTNDLTQLKADEYEQKLRTVTQRCLDNGTVVILSTIPPRAGQFEKSKTFADVARKVAKELNVPLIDYHAEILARRPTDWDGTLPQFKDFARNVYEAPTLISADGVHPSNPKQWANDHSEEALSKNGFGLRNHLTLLAYADVIRSVLK